MAHAFSVEIHDYLSEKILLARDGRKKAARDLDDTLCSYYDGQLLELTTMRQYLTDNFDLKTQKYY